MPLKEYYKKRNFTKTPEPKGKVINSKNFRFVIQKHDATRLHYDFRIEHDGVLKSWAVPKGPPYKSSEKHLAMQVEDHPLDYYDFEGVIPEGNYGAGEVIVWDMGNYWVPHAENESDVVSLLDAGFKKGEIKLVLNGKKVKGLFALVRFHKAGENGWLMIKDRDEYEGINFIENDKSVKSNKTLKQIADNNLISYKLREEISKFEFIEPMMAVLGDKAFDDPNYIFEKKLDGYRTIAIVDGDNSVLYSRKGEIQNEKFSKIHTAVSKLGFKGIIDGEVVAYDKNHKSSFQLLQNAKDAKGVIYHVFDILNFNGLETLNLPLIERKKILKKILKDSTFIIKSPYIVGKGKELFKKSKGSYEGIVAKSKDSIYTPGERSEKWIKIKNGLREEFVIGGVTKPQGKRKGFGSLILGYYKKDKLIYAGHVGTGFNDKTINTLFKSFEKIKIDESPFDNYIGDRTILFWMHPVLLCEVSFQEWTDDKMIRQGSFEGIRTDKLPSQVNMEDHKKNEKIKVENYISNPTKVYWPDLKYTKTDLAEYYLEIAPVILPYLKDRPQNLNRHPNGVDGKSFYQKDIEFDVPDFITTFDIKRDDPEKHREKTGFDKEITYLLCQNSESLLYMANLGCIEVNPWLSRVESLNTPDYLVFDIDPNDVAFTKVVETVNELRKLLEDIEITPYIKTSGKRGLHVYIYLGKGYTYEESRSFAELLGKIFVQRYPKLVSLERSPKDRKNKIYIDYLQNRKGQTTASVYSARPSQYATVSTPLKWSEVTAKLDPTSYTIKNTAKRVEKLGDLWADLSKSKTNLANSLDLLKKLVS